MGILRSSANRIMFTFTVLVLTFISTVFTGIQALKAFYPSGGGEPILLTVLALPAMSVPTPPSPKNLQSPPQLRWSQPQQVLHHTVITYARCAVYIGRQSRAASPAPRQRPMRTLPYLPLNHVPVRSYYWLWPCSVTTTTTRAVCPRRSA